MLLGVMLYISRDIALQILPIYTHYYNLYSDLGHALFFGGGLGLAALVGDMVKSLVKRRLGYKPGAMFQPWDGIDYMIGAILFMLPWFNGGLVEYIFLLIIGPLLSLLMNTIAYTIGWKECWY